LSSSAMLHSVSRRTQISRAWNQRHFSLTSLGAVSTLALAPAVAMFLRYRIAKPDQYLVRTGLFIKDINVSKQGLQWPFQRYEFISMHPRNYSFSLHGMSQEKLEFLLPVVFTIGPNKDPHLLMEYVRVLSGVERDASGTGINTVDSIILGILEGEVRTLSSAMSMEDIFNNRQGFKDTIIRNIQHELDKIGLFIYNANIKELTDSKDSQYFANLRQKKLSEAENQAKVDIAEARKVGDIGQKEREATTRQRVAAFEADTVLKENEMTQTIEKSKADLSVVQSQAMQRIEVARIEAINNAKMKETQLQKQVEVERISMETEKLRATMMSTAQVKAEALCRETEGEAAAVRLEADAALYAKQKEADGIKAVYQAQSEGVQKLIDSFAGDKNALVQYLMLDKGLYENLAKANAQAIQGLNPKITVWNTNSGGGSESEPIANIMKALPPMLSTIHNQTGIGKGSQMVELPNVDTKKE